MRCCSGAKKRGRGDGLHSQSPVSQSLGPQGLQIAHVVIDGAIDAAFIAEMIPERHALNDRAGILDPDHIAKIYWQLQQQPHGFVDSRTVQSIKARMWGAAIASGRATTAKS